MFANEHAWRSDDEIRDGLREIWRAMQDCVQRGIRRGGTLPGGLHVQRRAPALFAELSERARSGDARSAHRARLGQPLRARGERGERRRRARGHRAHQRRGRHHSRRCCITTTASCPGANEQGIFDFLLTAAAVGILYKENASISGAEVGCQGEVGVACSMAAAGLTAALGGTPGQIENAAEIGMEHNLGLTCDPIGGLVQIPCIERNAMGAVKAINASRMALRGDGKHKVSLDKVIKTMRDTGRDMQDKYKETSRGGLAVNVIEC